MDDGLRYFIGGMLSGVFLTVALSALAIAFYKNEVKSNG